ncbi:DNA-processing protein DprA [Persephonella sp.]
MTIIDYIEISFIKGLGNRRIKQIYETFGCVSEVLKEPELLVDSFGYSIYRTVKNRPESLRLKAEEEYRKAEKTGAEIITLGDSRYPQLLKEIPDPPPYIYVKGYLPEGDFISVVGSRKFSGYGEEVTRKLVDTLVENGIVVVSGLATGIDSIAHSMCVEKGGLTVAVLGNGIDLIFPPENRRLYSRILDSGAVISEFPVGTVASRFTFPKRNRIIAGLSTATVVTEAGEKSGALITAGLANDYGRTVFTVPTNINNPYGKGNNILLKEGAVPLTRPEDIFEHLPYLLKRNEESNTASSLTQLEKQILGLINEAVPIDILAEKTGMGISDLTVVLFEMEMKELIRIKDGMVYRGI